MSATRAPDRARDFTGARDTPCRACGIPLNKHNSGGQAGRTQHWFVPPAVPPVSHNGAE